MTDKIKIAICAFIKDEHQYLDEWIQYHLSLGINYIYLFEDKNSKSHSDICNKYNSVFLTLVEDFIDITNMKLKRQDKVYNHFIEVYKNIIDYTFFIDIDEFIIFEKGYNISHLIDLCDKKGPILLPWKCFGANDIIDNPHSKIMNTYTKECDLDFPKGGLQRILHSKSFANIGTGYMEFVHKYTNAHFISDYNNNNNTYQICWINHYITKSWEEWCNRLYKRGQVLDLPRSLEAFFTYNPEMIYLKEDLIKKPYCLGQQLFINH